MSRNKCQVTVIFLMMHSGYYTDPSIFYQSGLCKYAVTSDKPCNQVNFQLGLASISGANFKLIPPVDQKLQSVSTKYRLVGKIHAVKLLEQWHLILISSEVELTKFRDDSNNFKATVTIVMSSSDVINVSHDLLQKVTHLHFLSYLLFKHFVKNFSRPSNLLRQGIQ